LRKFRILILSIFIIIIFALLTYIFVASDYSKLEYYNIKLMNWYFILLLAFNVIIVLYTIIKKSRKKVQIGESIYKIHFYMSKKWQKVSIISFIIATVLLTLAFVLEPSLTIGIILIIQIFGFVTFSFDYRNQYIAENGIVLWNYFIYWKDIKDYKVIKEKHKIEIEINNNYNKKLKFTYSIEDEDNIIHFMSQKI